MRTIISVSVLAIGLQAQKPGVTEGNPVEFEEQGYIVERGFGAVAPMPGPGNDDQIGVTEGNPVHFDNEDGEYDVEFGLGAGAPMPGPGNDDQIGVTPENPVHFDTPDGEYTVTHGLGAGAPNDDLPDKLCTNGGVGCEGAPLPPKEDDDLPDKLCVAGQVGCFNPSVIEEDEMLPDRLCAPGDLNCTERDAGRLPDRLCSDGSWGCFSSEDSKKDSDSGTVINIFDDWFNSAVGLREITALSVGCATALMLSL